MSWTSPAPELADGPMTGDDRGILEGLLAWQRATLLNVCAGLTAEQLAARPVPTTQLSLLGLVRHLARVERVWLRERVAGQDVPGLYGWPVNGADFGEVDALRAEQEVAQLRAEWRLADAAVATVPFTHEIEVRGDVMSLRMVYLHLISEYARHNGHADLLREALDGVRGR
ncbi:MAG: DinB family protein [Cellulomonas sp.]